jgi:dTDP-4-amino-4,6-dideoxygalactose transaminase
MKDSALTERLAIENGPPLVDHTLPHWPHFDQDMIDAAANVLRSAKVNYWTGDEGRKFEREFAEFVGVKHAIAVANGTVALELALWAMEIGPGDEVIVPCRSFVATASAVAMRGATPIFADIDRDSQNITTATIEPLITPRTKAVIVVHLGGWPCDMVSICELARRYKLRVIEDCAQSLGASFKERQTGAWGDMAAFSFCQDKILTTAGEGGMVTTNDPALWERAWSFKDHGKSWDAVYNRPHPEPFRWLHESVGTNWRITEVQAAVGRVALRKVPEWVATRRRHAAALHAALQDAPGLRLAWPAVATPHVSEATKEHDVVHSHYRYYAFVDSEQLRPGWTRNRVVEAIQAEGVPCGVGVCPEMYREGAFAFRGIGPKERCPVAREVGETCLMFLVHPTLTDHHIRLTAEAVHKVLSHAVTESAARSAQPSQSENRAA